MPTRASLLLTTPVNAMLYLVILSDSRAIIDNCRFSKWARSEVVITPPCHGGDRRFKSGRARQCKCLIRVMGLLHWADLSVMWTGVARRAPVRVAKPRADLLRAWLQRKRTESANPVTIGVLIITSLLLLSTYGKNNC